MDGYQIVIVERGDTKKEYLIQSWSCLFYLNNGYLTILHFVTNSQVQIGYEELYAMQFLYAMLSNNIEYFT